MTKEQKFYGALKDIFIGAKVEGESGYINLMKIKSRYYEKGVFPELQKDVEDALKPFLEFREELFEKLYTFFHRYFSESGSIYFRYTPIHQNVYEKIYTDDKDVMLFWKTHPLYYVKTDRLFKNLDVEIGGFKFFFDVSTLEHKKAFEKREIIYEFKEIRKNKKIVFNVIYSERGRKTKIVEILRALKKEELKVTEDVLEKAFRVFEKQSEVDYFINKNAKEFLKEQFNIWLYQYVFSGESDWTEKRIKELQILKEIAFKIINFISQFEDELVKIWNKPKFVWNSNYVITLDRIVEKDKELKLIEDILKHENFNEQVKEWKDLGIVNSSFRKTKVIETDLTGKHLNKDFKHLPVDTKYFKDLELEFLSLFENLDNSLDGWLIKSENYQACNTMLLKFKERVQTIYIDPPFNTGEDFLYKDKFQDSTWLTLMQNRLTISRKFLNKKGSYYLHLDENANFFGKLLMYDIFQKNNYKRHIVWDKALNPAYRKAKKNYIRQKDDIYFYTCNDDYIFNNPVKINKKDEYILLLFVNKNLLKHILLFKNEKGYYIEQWNESCLKKQYLNNLSQNPIHVGTIWNDIWDFDFSILADEYLKFKTQKPELLLYRIISASSNQKDIILDFFLGIGTTITVAHKLNRKWIGVEMGEHFWEYYYEGKEKKVGVLGRMKKVLAGEKDKNILLNKIINWQGGGFFKYYEIEQYEDTLRKVKYEDADLFDNPYEDPYNQYIFIRDLKMIEALNIDYKKNKVKVDLSKLYNNIDVPETLSNLLGKWIKKITPDYVEFEDGEKIDIKNLDYKLIKPLIWW